MAESLVGDRGICLLNKRFLVGGMAVLIWVLSAVPAAARTFEPRGRAALLLDATSGQILYQQNGQATNYPASTTKLLTALVAVEHGKLDQKIKISEQAIDKAPDSSSCYLNLGEEQPLEHLLYGLLLPSGNDCADAIAEGVTGGNPAQFVTWMNETAKRVGATSSHFANPSGLHDPDHYTTALDLALIARAAFANPVVRKISGAKEFNWPGKSFRATGEELNGIYYNHNQMVFYYEGNVAGKTGYTEEAGLTLVNAAERNGQLLIGVVMGEPFQNIQYEDMENLLDMGFSDFERKAAVTKGSETGTVTVTGGLAENVTAVTGGEFWISAPKGATPDITVKPVLDSTAAAPVTAGQPLGKLEVRQGDRLLGTVPLLAKEAVDVKPATAAKLLSGLLTALKWVGGILLGLFAFRTVVKTVRRIRRGSRRRGGSFRGSGSRSRTSSITMYRTRD
jgi:serine-type D-Ala-D-Ala carboxypeptidase (penicillin-binding protein 5/6)